MQIKYNDKLTKTEKGYINGYYNSQHPKIKPHNPTQSIVEPEPPKEPVHIQDIMTMGEVAEYLSVSKMTLKRWDKLEKLKAIRINSRGDRRYLRSEVDKLLEGK